MDIEETVYLCGCKANGSLVSVSCPVHGKYQIHPLVLLLETFLTDYGFTVRRHQYSQGLKIYGKPRYPDDGGYAGKIFLEHGAIIRLHLPGVTEYPKFDLHDPGSIDDIISKLENKSS